MKLLNIDKNKVKGLIKISFKIKNNFSSIYRNQFRKHEDEIFFNNNLPKIIFITNDEYKKKYVKYFINNTTIPIVFNNDIIEDKALRKLFVLWKSKNCNKCINIIHRNALPVGNLNPKYMLIGEAPGVADGAKILERTMGYGKTSNFLRQSLIEVNILHKCWLTNIMKCSLRDNKFENENQYLQCFDFLVKEIDLLKPKYIFLLGKNVQKFLMNRLKKTKVKLLNIPHPSYCLYKSIGVVEYSKNFEIMEN